MRKFLMTILTAFMAVFSVSAVAGTVGQINNPSFEEGITDWSLSGQCSADYRTPKPAVSMPNGAPASFFGADPTAGDRLMPIATEENGTSCTVKSAAYFMKAEDVISFDFIFGDTTGMVDDIFQAVMRLHGSEEVQFSYQALDIKPYASTGWRTTSFTATADGWRTLEFTMLNLGDLVWRDIVAIDNVRITNGNGGGQQVPEPATMSLASLGLAGLMFARRRRTMATR
jgi:hypothetical protein